MKKKKQLQLGMFYKCANRNVGRIKSIEEGIVTANINAGHGGGDVKVKIEHCHEFKPKVDDRVLLCVDEEGEIPGFFLIKLSKGRQECN